MLPCIGCYDLNVKYENSGNNRFLESNRTNIDKWKLQYINSFMADNESATSLTPPNSGLRSIQFKILKVLESMISKDQITLLRLFHSRHTRQARCCCYKNDDNSCR